MPDPVVEEGKRAADLDVLVVDDRDMEALVDAEDDRGRRGRKGKPRFKSQSRREDISPREAADVDVLEAIGAP